MALEKLKLLIEEAKDAFTKEVSLLFNPNKLAFGKIANWATAPLPQRNTAPAQFTHGEPATLTLELFFDSFEDQTDVRDQMKDLFTLTEVLGDLHRPPLCRLVWGRYNFEDFKWAVQSMNHSYSLFLSDGRPARANMTCQLKQWRSDAEDQKEIKAASPDVAKTRILLLGETLSSIAAQEYNDPALWRPIAEANGIDNPRRLKPGQLLAIPPLPPGTTSRR
jgi:hypothetical protein